MNRCFKGFLNLENISLSYDKDSNDIISYNFEEKPKINNDHKISEILNDVLMLLKKYKNNDLITFEDKEPKMIEIENELLVLIFLNYQIIFHLVYNETSKLNKYEKFLKINDSDKYIIDIKNIIDYYYAHRKHRLIVLFSFLQKIHDIFEIKLDSKI